MKFQYGIDTQFREVILFALKDLRAQRCTSNIHQIVLEQFQIGTSNEQASINIDQEMLALLPYLLFLAMFSRTLNASAVALRQPAITV
jgi:hypothetical protein